MSALALVVFLVLCLGMHTFMHRGHAAHARRGRDEEGPRSGTRLDRSAVPAERRGGGGRCH